MRISDWSSDVCSSDLLDPRDGVHYTPLTTVAGILQKHTGVVPFDAPKPLRDAIAKGDFGSTADPVLKTQTVDFMTNLDTTGGNSGSPVLDAKGRDRKSTRLNSSH